jgi:hypothetical protein
MSDSYRSGWGPGRGPQRLSLTLALIGVVLILLAFVARLGEFALVLGLFLLLLAGGVLNWDRRSGH